MRCTSARVKVDTDRLPPVFELRLSPESWNGPAAVAQRNLLKLPSTFKWCGITYTRMGYVKRCWGLPENGMRYSAKVIIDQSPLTQLLPPILTLVLHNLR